MAEFDLQRESEPTKSPLPRRERVSLQDNRPSSADSAQRQAQLSQKNSTGLPNQLKSGIETLSGMSMDHVNVHYNSSKPAQLNAHAYAQGSDIHLATGQEKHLPHEAWHVVQQAQGRVKPTIQMKGNVHINDDAGLEKEADVMGNRAKSSNYQFDSIQLLNLASTYHQSNTLQKVIIQGADANESSDVASVGYSRLISQSEIQNTNEFLKEENRAGGKKIFSIDNLDGITFDPVNYLNGHYQEGKGYLGLAANALATLLQESGLTSGQNIILTGCESAGYANQLAVALHALGIDVTVTGAQGIAFDYKSDDGTVVEAMFNSKLVPPNVNTQHNLKNKMVMAHKYEQIFINEITSTIFGVGTLTEQEKFFGYFQSLGRKKIKYLENTNLTPERIEELTAARNVFQRLIGGANGPDIALVSEPTINQLIAYSKEVNRPAFSRDQLISFKNRLNALIPGKKDVGSSADELRSQTGNGHFIFDEYTSKDQLWIKDFMGVVKKADDSLVKKFILKKYVEIGRQAANEYIKTMAEGYNIDANQAVLNNGWVSFTHQGQSGGAHATFREVADL